MQSCAHFEIHKTDGRARAGLLTTKRGQIETPIFMPVGTRASVKAVPHNVLEEMNAQIILANTYHIILRPGLEIIEAAGGVPEFMNWQRPMLTDSGGYQVFSLAKLRKMKQDGVQFQSHIDGSKMFLGPVEAMNAQRIINSDIAMVFDECPPWPCTFEEAEKSLELTTRWAKTSSEQPRADGQLVFGICQGSGYPELRQRAAESLVEIGFDGYAIGGVSVGEPEEKMYEVIEMAEPSLPTTHARYLMGVGTPPQLVEAVARGIDMFDCVLPTRVGRNGSAYTKKGMIQVKSAKFKQDFTPIEEDCTCPTCQRYTKAYIRHLVNVGETLALQLLSVHNIHFYLDLVRQIRSAIIEGEFEKFRNEFHAHYVPPQKVK